MIVTNTPQNQIRKAEKIDVPVIIELAKATWEPTYRDILSKAQLEFMFNEMYSPASLETQMNSLGHTFLILYIQGKPSGYASYSEKPEAKGVFKLQKLYLLPELQGKGLGRKLIEAVEEQEEGTGMSTTDGFTIDESGRLNNFAVEPEMYVEEK